MGNGNDRRDELDGFWDLSSLTPKRRETIRNAPVVSTADISFTPPTQHNSDESDPTVIKRYVDPLYNERRISSNESIDTSETYTPDSALIHSVTLKKKRSAYEFYEDFVAFALKHKDIVGSECEFADYYSYVPQYDQLSSEQRDYYFWWRESFRAGRLIRTDISYILLYVYELINLGDTADVKESLDTLVRLWNTYHKEFTAISGKLALWICDFCLLHKLSVPKDIDASVVRYVQSLKEFYINIPRGDMEVCAHALLLYCSEYDYKKSKFFSDKTSSIFDKHVYKAVLLAVRYFSPDGVILSSLVSDDNSLCRRAFDGALCASRWRYDIEVSFCSFSRSNELRFIIGDIVKYAENKIRAFIGVKSRLSVYSVSKELQTVLDRYFASAFAAEQYKPKRKAEEKQDYDALYDLPQRPFSLENAKRIENESWSTTNDLVSAFADEDATVYSVDSPQAEPAFSVGTELAETDGVTIKSTEPAEDVTENIEPSAGLTEYADAIEALKARNNGGFCRSAQDRGMMPDTLADVINEIAYELIGDKLIDDGDSGFEIIEDYLELI